MRRNCHVCVATGGYTAIEIKARLENFITPIVLMLVIIIVTALSAIARIPLTIYHYRNM